MTFNLDLDERSVSFSAARGIYSDDALRIAAHIFSGRVEVFHSATKASHELTLVAKKAKVDGAELEALGGEFLNELLNQEYRFIMARFNRKIADLITHQALLSARGAESAPAAPPDSPELKADIDRMMAATAEEIRRTMPKKLPPQGPPIPAALKP